MSSIHDIIHKVERYARQAETSPEAVCRAATANPRLYSRLKRRAKQTASDIERLEQHMKDNPIVKAAGADQHTVKGVVGSAAIQGQAVEKVNASDAEASQ